MRKILLLLALLIPGVCLASTNVTFVGDDDYPPYIYSKDGKVMGKYAQLINQAFELMPDYELSWDLMPWDEAMSKIKDGSAFAIVPPYYRPKTRPWIEPYSIPVITEKVILICNKDNMKGEKSNFPKDFAGMTFTNDTANANPGDDFLAMQKNGEITVIESHDSKENISKVFSGEADCYVNNKLLIDQYLVEMDKSMDDLYHKTLREEQGYVGFAKDASKFPYKSDFIEKFNAALEKVISSQK